MRMIIASFLMMVCTAGFAADKDALASKFYDATTAKQIENIVDGMALALLREKPTWQGQSKIYREWALETFKSAEYKKIYTSRLVKMFSEQELTELVKLSANPVFVTYMQRWQEFPQSSSAEFTALMRSRNPELARRLKAAGFNPYE